MLRLITVCIGGFVATSALTAPAKVIAPRAEVLGATPIYREIKDWVIACDNTRVCFAKYASADDGGDYLSITREPGPAGKLAVSIEVYDGDSVPEPQSLRLDGRPVAEMAWRIDRKAQTASLHGDEALRFVRAIGGGRQLAYIHGGERSTISLSGLSAVLVAMDEDQGRLGTVSALVRPGSKPDTAAFAAILPPVIRTPPEPPPLADAARFAAKVRRGQGRLLDKYDCEADRASDDRAFALDKDNALVLLGCVLGAYQGSALAFEAPRTAPERAQLLVLPVPPTESEDPDYAATYVSADWDAKTSTFFESSKGRGLADCGSSTRWTFDGRRFVLSSHNQMWRCGGPPGDWPTVYRTRVVPAR